MNYEPFAIESCFTLAGKCSGKDYYLSTRSMQIIGRLSNKSMQNLYKSIKYYLLSSFMSQQDSVRDTHRSSTQWPSCWLPWLELLAN